jgi:MFS family permease
VTRRTGLGYDLFRDRQFRELWAANVVSSLGTVMSLLAAAWVMTSLTDKAFLVTAVQTAVSLPFVFLSIPFGIITDMFGHRRMLLVAHSWMVLPAMAMALIEWIGHLTPWVLLSLLFLIGIGTVMHQAAWKPLLYDVLPRESTVSAMSLNTLGSKIAQLAGPGFGGLAMFAGAALIFAIRGLSHIAVVLVVSRVPKPAPRQPSGQAHPLAQARRSIRQGWRFLRGAPEIYGTLIRCALFMAPCAGMLALLPLEAKENIQTEVLGYGGLLTSLAIGTVSAVSLMPLLQNHLRVRTMATVALAGFALAVLGISRWDSMFLDAGFLVLAGFCWGILNVSQQASVQIASPDGMRGLMTSFYSLTVQGSMALGSLIFGVFAEYRGVSASILLAGCVAACGLLLVRWFPLSDGVAAQVRD